MSFPSMLPGPASTPTSTEPPHSNDEHPRPPPSPSAYDPGETSGSDTRSSNWVDADGSDDGGSGKHTGGGANKLTSLGVRIGSGTISSNYSINGNSINGSSSSSSSLTDPAARRTRKRGRSLRKNVLLRTRGVLMTNLTTNGLGIIIPGMVLGSQHTSSPTTINETDKPTSPTTPTTTTSSTTTLIPKPTTTTTIPSPDGYSSASPSFPSTFIDLPWSLPPRDSIDPLADTVWWGWAILGGTWLVFVVGMGSVLGVWEWAWDVGDRQIPVPSFLQSSGKDGGGVGDEWDELPIPGYYPALMILTIVIAWVWVIVAWVGMKYFKHAKIQPQSDDT